MMKKYRFLTDEERKRLSKEEMNIIIASSQFKFRRDRYDRRR